MSDHITRQAREYARKAIAPHSVYEVKRLAEVERGFIAGATRTITSAEVEEAAKAAAKAIGKYLHPGAYSYEKAPDVYQWISESVIAALGMRP